ncbi:hypothetical protein CTI12_AA096140 [Artemisia annua]|uniref:Uncharacterized protein n=1 Tax=Artemisia annua TaxID=35608 RepID=A0A2U1PYL0_ARTAN|nr:hypothetical protein CTI12_AA096140 [Artemisia annua]
MLYSSSLICLEKEKEEMIEFKTREGNFEYIPFQRFEAVALENNLFRGRLDDLSSEVDDLSSLIQQMVPRSELDSEKRRVAKWKRRAEERRFYANHYHKKVCALEDKLESSRRRYKNLVCRTNKHIRAYRHLSKVAFVAQVMEIKRLKSASDSLVRSRHSVSMENQRLRAEIAALRREGTSRAMGFDPKQLVG